MKRGSYHFIVLLAFFLNFSSIRNKEIEYLKSQGKICDCIRNGQISKCNCSYNMNEEKSDNFDNAINADNASDHKELKTLEINFKTNTIRNNQIASNSDPIVNTSQNSNIQNLLCANDNCFLEYTDSVISSNIQEKYPQMEINFAVSNCFDGFTECGKFLCCLNGFCSTIADYCERANQQVVVQIISIYCILALLLISSLTYLSVFPRESKNKVSYLDDHIASIKEKQNNNSIANAAPSIIAAGDQHQVFERNSISALINNRVSFNNENSSLEQYEQVYHVQAL